MAAITAEMVHQAYEAARCVYAGSLSRPAARWEVAKATGMGPGSASDYITVFLSMIGGQCYKRTINLYATEYYLELIGQDYGRAAQQRADQAVAAHVAYYRQVHAYLSKTDQLARRYL